MVTGGDQALDTLSRLLDWGVVYDLSESTRDVFPRQFSIYLLNDEETCARICKHIPVLEFQYQGLDSLMAASQEELAATKETLRATDAKVTMHGSFIKNDYYQRVGPQNIDEYQQLKKSAARTLKEGLDVKNKSPVHAYWDVVPRGYDNELLLPSETSLAERQRMLDVAAYMADVNPDNHIILSRHVTTMGAFLDEQGFERFLHIQDEQRTYGVKRGVTYALENGGTTRVQLERLITEGFPLVLDVNHLVCDGDYERAEIHDPLAYAVELVERGVVAEVHASSMIARNPDGTHSDTHYAFDYDGPDADLEHLERIARVLNAMRARDATTGQRTPVILEMESRPAQLVANVKKLYALLGGNDE